MSAGTLLLGAALDGLTLVLYVWVGLLVHQRLARAAGRAGEAFAVFWFGVGLVNGLQMLLSLVAAGGDPGLALALAVWTTRIALALVSFAGLVYYLLYVYTGRAWLVGALAVFYTGVFLLMMWWMYGAAPVAADVGAWRVDIEYGAPDAMGGLFRMVVLLFFVPPLVAAVAYGRLLRHLREPEQRYRGRIVAASLAIYFVGLTAGYMNLDWAWWGLVENLLGLGAGVAGLLALRPPGWVRARLLAEAAA